jgi:hypothetical protein
MGTGDGYYCGKGRGSMAWSNGQARGYAISKKRLYPSTSLRVQSLTSLAD